jgi:hypothetical protein
MKLDFSLKIDIYNCWRTCGREICVLFTDPGAHISAAIKQNKSKVHSRSGSDGSEGEYPTLSFISALGSQRPAPTLYPVSILQ